MQHDFSKLPFDVLVIKKGEYECKRAGLTSVCDSLLDLINSIPRESVSALGDSVGEHDEHEDFILAGMRVAYVNAWHIAEKKLNACRDAIIDIDFAMQERVFEMEDDIS